MKTLFFATTLVVALTANATLYTVNPVNNVVPDNDYNGWVSSTVITGHSGIIQAGSLQVTLNLTGGWNGDLYAYLVNSSGGFVVLLDRVGVGEGVGSYGYGDAGMNVTLGSSGDNIHSYGANTLLSGIPSGPYTPDTSGITSASGSLDSFANPNGTWTLFVADLSVGGVTTVTDWGLQMDIVAVPEMETWVAAALAGAFGAFWLKRQIWGTKRPKPSDPQALC